ncbi:MAG: ATP-binding protein [bacterium]
MSKTQYPFSAVVGHEELKKAMLVNAVDPSIGGILIRGPRGTGKSTLARGLIDVFPEQSVVERCPYRCNPEQIWEDCPYCEEPVSKVTRQPSFANLPLGSSIDQVLGTIDLERVMSDEQVAFQPGILARAHRGILYVDEVNLLPDRLVDSILDVSESGWNHVERDGVSFEHPSDFILLGTMNPEEGSLRPQLSDRFGLCVDVNQVQDPDRRTTLVRRVQQFEKDPVSFYESWREQQEQLRQAVINAREILSEVELSSRQRRRISERALEENVDGHRTDIVASRTACALSAWEGEFKVSNDNLEMALNWSLAHRRNPGPDSPSPDRPSRRSSSTNGKDGSSQQRSHSKERETTSSGSGKQDQATLKGQAFETKDSTVNSNHVVPEIRYHRGLDQVRRKRPDYGRFSPVESIRAMIQRQFPGSVESRLEPQDVRFKARLRSDRLDLYVLDTSGSMLRGNTLGWLKGSMVRQLQSIGENRKISLIGFRANGAEVLLQPTDQISRAVNTVKTLQAGGNTPVSDGLKTALNLVGHIKNFVPRSQIHLYMMSDGRFEVDRSLRSIIYELVHQTVVHFIDTSTPDQKWGSMSELHKLTDSEYIDLSRRVA